MKIKRTRIIEYPFVEPVYQRIGANIFRIRKLAGIRQQELADAVVKSRGSIANIEIGRQRIMLHDVYYFAKALKVKPQVLMKGVW